MVAQATCAHQNRPDQRETAAALHPPTGTSNVPIAWLLTVTRSTPQLEPSHLREEPCLHLT